ncbi:MAG: RidA family protein [Pseudomonadota bacterium]
MTRTLISSGSPFEKTAGYSRAVVQDTPAGRWVFVAGTTGYDYDTMTMPEGVEAQARQTLQTIGKTLEEAGCGFEHVVRCTYYVTDRAHVAKVFPILGEVFGGVRPAATMVTCQLNEPDMLIEIEVTALKVD